MKKYIDADVMLQKAIEGKKFVFRMEEVYKDNSIVFKTVYKDLGNFIRNLPAANVKEVVLCRDCQYFGMMSGIPCCQNINGLISPQTDSFCSNGKEKTTR